MQARNYLCSFLFPYENSFDLDSLNCINSYKCYVETVHLIYINILEIHTCIKHNYSHFLLFEYGIEVLWIRF